MIVLVRAAPLAGVLDICKADQSSMLEVVTVPCQTSRVPLLVQALRALADPQARLSF